MDQELIEALSHRHIGMSDPTIAALLTQDEPTQVPDLRGKPPPSSTKSRCAPVSARVSSRRSPAATISSACWWSAAALPAPSRRISST
jgi:hypothetical protein